VRTVFGPTRPAALIDHRSTARQNLESQLEAGIIAGIISALPTTAILALGGIIAGYGPAAPFYAVVSILSPGALESALAEHAEDATPTFFQQQFAVGFGLCLVLAAISGVVYALGTRRRTVVGWARYLLGGLHGVVMMCFFYLGALQTVGAIAHLEVDAMSLSHLIGWPVLVLAHVVHGVVLARVIRSRLASTDPRVEQAAS